MNHSVLFWQEVEKVLPDYQYSAQMAADGGLAVDGVKVLTE